MEAISQLSKPITKLIEVVASGIGTISRSHFIRKSADALAYEIKTISSAINESKASVGHIEYNSEGLIIISKDTDAIEVLPAGEGREFDLVRRGEYVLVGCGLPVSIEPLGGAVEPEAAAGLTGEHRVQAAHAGPVLGTRHEPLFAAVGQEVLEALFHRGVVEDGDGAIPPAPAFSRQPWRRPASLARLPLR